MTGLTTIDQMFNSLQWPSDQSAALWASLACSFQGMSVALQTCHPLLWNWADWVKPRFESINSITAVWLRFKVDRRKAVSVWTRCIQGLNCDFFFFFVPLPTPWSSLLHSCTQIWPSSRWPQGRRAPVWTLGLNFLCNTNTEAPCTLKMPSRKVMQKSYQARTLHTFSLSAGFTCMCVHAHTV